MEILPSKWIRHRREMRILQELRASICNFQCFILLKRRLITNHRISMPQMRTKTGGILWLMTSTRFQTKSNRKTLRLDPVQRNRMIWFSLGLLIQAHSLPWAQFKRLCFASNRLKTMWRCQSKKHSLVWGKQSWTGRFWHCRWRQPRLH